VVLAATASIVIMSAAPAGAVVSPVPVSVPVAVVPENSVSTFGSAPSQALAAPRTLAAPLVGIATRPSGTGSWLVASDGGVFTTGDAAFLGSLAGRRLSAPIVGIAATKSGSGYWLAASDGGVFTFGDAPFLGSLAGRRLASPIVGIAATKSGSGYWLVASDGGVFTFGDAPFLGSLGASPGRMIVGMAPVPGDTGYWLATTDGGVFSFGTAPFLGSAVALRLVAPVVAITAVPGGLGYWLAGADGGVFSFGSATFAGAAPAGGGAAPTVAMAVVAGGYVLVHGTTVAPAHPGDVGANVARLQARLLALGYWLGDPPGRYGNLTFQAVEAFQKVSGLPINGAVDTMTATALGAAGRPVAGVTSGDLIEIDKRRQVLLVVRNGLVQWAFNTSTGSGRTYLSGRTHAVARTPDGSWRLERQVDGIAVSRLGRLYRPKYFTVEGHAIHGYPSVPPFPASHGCVRVSNPAMDFLWSSGLAPLGSTVLVH
jgi:hypothetical protein